MLLAGFASSLLIPRRPLAPRPRAHLVSCESPAELLARLERELEEAQAVAAAAAAKAEAAWAEVPEARAAAARAAATAAPKAAAGTAAASRP